ncbi:ABC transporter substrate-binding protein [Asticcacaulis tiandongensis]|uniref:ABC transporter substrate-binding protein n=1 Tax=Asticcacaulis tiandongensis TaxID=2565365 RepID=UPI00112EA63A|nr:ABC transporter substrate-binding protein [Asticcacaulis tiandongensis]
MTYHSTIPLVPSDTLWFYSGPVPTATSLAHRQDFLGKYTQGTGFQLKPLKEARDVTLRAQHFHHDIKTLVREGGNVFPIFNRARNLAQRGYDNTVVIGLTWVDEVQVLLARPGLGFDGQGIGALKGKRLGLSHTPAEVDVWQAMALRGFDTALKLAGLTFEDVILSRIKGPDLRFQPYARRGDNGSRVTEEALLRGEIDVIYARGAAAIQLQQAHNLEVVLDINALDDPKLRVNNGTPRLLTVHRHLLDDHPDLVTRYLKALRVAGQWASEHPREVVEILAEDTDSTPESVRRGYGPRLEHIFDIKLNSARVAALQDQVDFLHRFGLIEIRFDVGAWINTSPLVQSSLLRDH